MKSVIRFQTLRGGAFIQGGDYSTTIQDNTVYHDLTKLFHPLLNM